MSRGKSVYELQKIHIRGTRYPRREVSLNRIGLFWTMDEAENAMLTNIAEEKSWCAKYGSVKDYYKDCLGYYIHKEQVFHQLTPITYPIVDRFSYTANGELNDFIAIEGSEYLGRKVEDIRFHKGDIVEVVGRFGAELAMVCGTPPTVERVEYLRQRSSEQYPDYPFKLDDTDDSYTVLCLGDGDTHSHPSCYTVFKPTCRVPDSIEAKLKAKLEEVKRMWESYTTNK